MKRIPYSFNKCEDMKNNPKVNQVVWCCDLDQVDMRLVLVTDGEYVHDGSRLSIWWHWQEVFEDGNLGRVEQGYGNFYEYNGSYHIKISVELA